jgi:microsomal prostaglandin-E synthase 2
MLARQTLIRISPLLRGQTARFFAANAQADVPSVKLYQYAICPFCNQAKAILSYTGIDYHVVEVNPLTKAELKPWSGDYKKVPIAIIDDKQVNGSDEIVSALLNDARVVASLESKWSDMTLDEFKSSPSAEKWTAFAKDDLAALLYPNICRTLGDSFAAFGYVKDVPTFSTFDKLSIRGLGSLAMYLAASKIKSKRGITDERQALNDVLAQWEEEGLGSNKTFASGKEEPNLGDLAVFGTLRAVEGLPAHSESVKQHRGGALPEWYDRMKQQVYNVS